ncbi:MAG: glycine C-acetyltransferase [Chlamydiota bacterium]
MVTDQASMREALQEELRSLHSLGLYKKERVLFSPQEPSVALQDQTKLLNLCSNNYLGLSNHPEIVEAAKQALSSYGFGMSSARFICGTNDLHKQLEQKTAAFLEMEAAIVFPSCFDANAGVFEALLHQEDAVFSDALNHASLIDGIRLCKAARFRYKHLDLEDLETLLQKAQGFRRKIIVSDGVFSMDGEIAPIGQLVDLAQKYNALLLIDDCHATGILGAKGRGSHEHANVLGKVDIITGTYGKALGGASGGFIAASEPIIAMLRQKARPYLFSNALPPPITAGSYAAIDLIEKHPEWQSRLWENAKIFREGMLRLGFSLIPGEHPIVPVLMETAEQAQKMASLLLEKGVYVIPFFYPVVPKDSPRIRVQLSSSHTKEDLKKALRTFQEVGENLGILPANKETL